ncbi:sensor histidine kinase [Spirosoma koreense]
MLNEQLIRRYEQVLIAGAAIIYVTRRLVLDVNRFDTMIDTAEKNGVSSALIGRNLAGYDHTVNNNVPLIAGVCLMLMAWYTLRRLDYPFRTTLIVDRKAGLILLLTGLLLLASAFVYHYFKLQLRYQHDELGKIIGLKVFSVFSKRTVLADAVGLGIFLIAYELLAHLFNYLHRNLAAELSDRQQALSYLPYTGLVAILGSLAMAVNLPPTLWRSGTRDLPLVMGLVIQLVFLQAYAHTFILPVFRTSRRAEPLLISRVTTFLLTGFVATLVLWGAVTNFHYRPFDPVVPFTCLVWVGALAIAYVRRGVAKENVALQTQVSTQSAELAGLRAQINPHFLFNALNSLYATALKENSEKTADGIQKLGDMMRFMLQENHRDRIPLDKEIEYLHNYIQIQRMRLDETQPIEIRVMIQEPDRPIYLAPMLLTPFVENAFKHGISFRHPSWIYITLTLDATQLYFKVHNSRHPKTAHDPEESQPGIGLDNVRKRLELIYPGRHQLLIQQSEQDYFVSLTLTYW